MVLEQHRSALIPTVSFAAGGRIVLGDGTFPLSHGAKRRDQIPDFRTNDKILVDSNDNKLDVESFRSYDPSRKPRFLKHDSGRHQNELSPVTGGGAGGGTVSSGGSQSLQRKLRRFRSQVTGDDADDENEAGHRGAPRFGTLNLTGTISVSERRRAQRAEEPYYHNYHPDTSGRASGKRRERQRLGLGTLRRGKPSISTEDAYSRHGNALYDHRSNGYMDRIPETVMVRNKKIADEWLPGVFFVVAGGLMFVLALTKFLLSWWTALYAPLWTASSVLGLGITGVLHKGDYLTKWLNAMYITFGVLSIVTTVLCVGILINISGPQAIQMWSGFTLEAVAIRSNYTKTGQSLAGNLSVQAVVTLNVGIDFSIIVLCMANFYSLTATIVAISNHWDAVYETTGDCDHRGNPRLFNPLEQAILGLVVCFFGSVLMAFTSYENSLYGIPVITGALIVVAGFASFFYGKRPDLVVYGLLALVLEFLALTACGVSTVLLAFALVGDSLLISTQDIPSELVGVNKEAALQSLHSAAIVTLVTIVIYFIMMVANIIFASGLLFRACRKACCYCATDDNLIHQSRF